MNTLAVNELAAVCGGIDPLSGATALPSSSPWQDFLDQFAREQEAAFLRGLIMECAD
jgi:hypothetical protein